MKPPALVTVAAFSLIGGMAPIAMALSPTSPATAAIKLAAAPQYFVTVPQGSPLYVYDRAAESAEVIGSIPNGAKVIRHLSDRTGEWLEISAARGVRGWVPARYLVDRSGNSASPQLRAASRRLAQSHRTDRQLGNRAYVMTTSTDRELNVRGGASKRYGVVATLRYGTPVMVQTTDAKGESAEVIAPGNVRGWVMLQYLVDDQGRALQDMSAPNTDRQLQQAARRLADSVKSDNQVRARQRLRTRASSRYVVRTSDGEGLNLRRDPQINADIMAMLRDDEAVTRMRAVGEWMEIVTTDDLRGYVMTQYLVAN